MNTYLYNAAFTPNVSSLDTIKGLPKEVSEAMNTRKYAGTIASKGTPTAGQLIKKAMKDHGIGQGVGTIEIVQLFKEMKTPK